MLKLSQLNDVNVQMIVNTSTTLTTCFDQIAVSVRTISDQKAVDDSPCLLKVEVEDEVRGLKAGNLREWTTFLLS
ncbi:hypothetical protein DPMN_185135 [Dreissena polymorpha]|uniref:Uncharacterized protein n=1 Tax=Dreissena polymorpha TaxID=45954 RepID=A0A9D4I821_DREPO|nr:hypothetical protein DPMN_185135 [Dreissena polymorpha]